MIKEQKRYWYLVAAVFFVLIAGAFVLRPMFSDRVDTSVQPFVAIRGLNPGDSMGSSTNFRDSTADDSASPDDSTAVDEYSLHLLTGSASLDSIATHPLPLHPIVHSGADTPFYYLDTTRLHLHITQQ